MVWTEQSTLFHVGLGFRVGFANAQVMEGRGFHTAVRGTMFVRSGAVTPGPSHECDITFFAKGRPKSAQQLRDSTVAVRRAQSTVIPGDTRMSFPWVKVPPVKQWLIRVPELNPFFANRAAGDTKNANCTFEVIHTNRSNVVRIRSERTIGAEKASCGETVVQKGVFGESGSALPLFKTPENPRRQSRTGLSKNTLLDNRFSTRCLLCSFPAPP